MSRSRDLAVALALAAVAFVLRATDLDLLEFKGDEAQAVHLALPMAEGKALPEIGLMSSVGLHNPPLFIWLSAAPVAVTVDPRWVTAGLIGLFNALAVALTYLLFYKRIGRFPAAAAALVFATGVWPVLYGRKLWAQCCLPPFSVLLFWALTRTVEVPKARAVFWVPLLVCVMWQLHFSGIPMAVVVVAALAFVGKQLNWKAFLAGLVASVVLTLPYVNFQRNNGWPDVTGLINMAKGKRADGAAKEASHRSPGDAFYWTGFISAAASVDYALGPGSKPDFDGSRSSLSRGAAVGTTVLTGGLIAIGVVILGALAFAPKFRGDKRRALAQVTFGVSAGYLALMSLLGIEQVYPHYFIILYPAPFLALGLALDGVAQWGQSGARTGSRVGAIAAGFGLALVVAGHLWTLGAFHGYLKDRGGTTGDYGVAYVHKAALVDWVVASGLEIDSAPGWEFGHMVGVRRTYVDPNETAARVTAPLATGGERRVRIYDGLRQPAIRAAKCPGRQDFGPLVACLR
jgi:hypothetical protein